VLETLRPRTSKNSRTQACIKLQSIHSNRQRTCLRYNTTTTVSEVPTSTNQHVANRQHKITDLWRESNAYLHKRICHLHTSTPSERTNNLQLPIPPRRNPHKNLQTMPRDNLTSNPLPPSTPAKHLVQPPSRLKATSQRKPPAQ
jgi:hypothetical protein